MKILSRFGPPDKHHLNATVPQVKLRTAPVHSGPADCLLVCETLVLDSDQSWCENEWKLSQQVFI